MDLTLLRAELYAEFQQPGGAWQTEAPIPMSERGQLVAAFNGGFRIGLSRGVATTRRVERRDRWVVGAASLVITTDGRLTVGEWGRDVHMGPGVVSVRQNLASSSTIAPVAGLNDNVGGRWGRTLGNKLFVVAPGGRCDGKRCDCLRGRATGSALYPWPRSWSPRGAACHAARHQLHVDAILHLCREQRRRASDAVQGGKAGARHALVSQSLSRGGDATSWP